ncbi:glycosyltransferase [Globicatella sp. PHS-GS-PNBC-21-1553]|uniref:glycosyltransferase n=1 Tax=Globicatella sp. PHS-GS-PNBC-21-1553 TaxID=2885764 RepID=UPI00298EF682|nr:glycosyltransferase [Globicatella sp. PHS-GS-PNBC-21-1553]WPC09062.1 glycosyltransferase [Globicatella sp. PHS-GS-PNBC-21-1553]
MKIVHFINSLGSGGAEKVVVNITTNLSSKYNFEIITKNNDNIYESELKKKNISVIDSPELRGNIIKHCIFLYKYFKMNFKEISLVHIHAGTINYFLPLIFAAIFKVPVIVHSHGSKSSSFYGAIIHKILRIIVFNLFRTYNIACSKEAGKWMFYNKHYNIIYNGIDLRKYKHIPEKNRLTK